MIKRKTIQIGNKIMRAKAKRITFPLQKNDIQIIKDLIGTMKSENLVGMSAPQIGISKRIFIA